MLQSMGLQRVVCDLATEQKQQESGKNLETIAFNSPLLKAPTL